MVNVQVMAAVTVVNCMSSADAKLTMYFEWSGGSVVQANFDRKKAVDEFFIVIIAKNADVDQVESDGLSLR